MQACPKNPMGPGPHQKKLPTHGLSLGPSQHRLLSNCKRRGSFATFPASQNTNVPYRPCVLLPIFSHARTFHHWCQNSSKLSTKMPRLPCHLMLVYSALPSGGMSRVPKKSNDNQVTVGIHFSPEEFLNEAVRLCHPTEHNSLFPREVRANVAHLSNNTVHQIAMERIEEVKGWVALSKELSAKERDLKSSISPRIAEVIKDKRLCLRERLLEEAGHEDTSLVEDIKKGFDLTGALPRSGVFNQNSAGQHDL